NTAILANSPLLASADNKSRLYCAIPPLPPKASVTKTTHRTDSGMLPSPWAFGACRKSDKAGPRRNHLGIEWVIPARSISHSLSAATELRLRARLATIGARAAHKALGHPASTLLPRTPPSTFRSAR